MMIPRTYNAACDYPWQTENPKKNDVQSPKDTKITDTEQNQTRKGALMANNKDKPKTNKPKPVKPQPQAQLMSGGTPKPKK